MRALVCDEYSVFRRQMVLALEADSDIEVLGEAPDANVAKTVAEQMAPDVVVLGAHLPSAGSVQTAALLHELVPLVRTILTVDFDHERVETEVRLAVRAGITGFVARDAISSDGAAAVRAVAAGRPVLSPLVASAVLVEYDTIATDGIERGLTPPSLERRERDLLERLAEGATIPDAADAITVAAATASNLVANALAKLHRHARSEATAPAQPG